MSPLGNVGGRLYRGEVSVDFVGRRRLWYAISGLILVISIVAVFGRGLNFSVDFKGGAQFQFPAGSTSISQVRNVVSGAGGGTDAIVQEVKGAQGGPQWQVQTDPLPYAKQAAVKTAISKSFGVPQSGVSLSFVGPQWGSQISQKALEALIAFLIVIVGYLSIAFDWRMAAAALIALAHDIVITIGVYALLHFTVSPASVIGLLTILGYSLYDTVVVFDKVRENTAGLLSSSRSTYSQAANLALNQTLVRSINTSVIALLPVAAILFVGASLLGAGELRDLALVLFVGMLSGTYSSICIATPVLADLKERQPQFKALAKRVSQREAGGRAAAKRATAKAGAGRGAARGGVAGGGARSGTSDAGDGAEGLREPGGQAQDAADAASSENDDTSAAGDRVTAGQAAPRGTPGSPGRPGPRQQPRRSGTARRRPGGKKKRR